MIDEALRVVSQQSPVYLDREEFERAREMFKRWRSCQPGIKERLEDEQRVRVGQGEENG